MARVVRLHLQDVVALGRVLVVVAASDGVDEVVQRGHAVPAPRHRHGLTFHPRLAVLGHVVAQQVLAVRADLVVVSSGDVDQTVVDRPRVAVGEPGEGQLGETGVCVGQGRTL